MTALNSRARYALPAVVIIAVACLMTLMLYPMMNAQMKGLPVAVLSKDEGAVTPQGEMNAGDTLVDKLTSATSSDGDSPMIWYKVNDKAALDKGFDDGDYYAAITIPKDFTAKTVAAQQAKVKKSVEQASALAQTMAGAQAEAAAKGLSGEQAQQFVQAAAQKAAMEQASAASTATSSGSDASAPTITVTVDNAKSPLVASLLKQSIPTMLGKSGANVKVKTLNQGDVKTGSSLPTAAMMGQNVLIMPTYLMSMIVGVLVCVTVGRRKSDDKPQRWVSVVLQLLCALGWSLAVALGADCIFAMLGSGWLPWSMVAFLWLASFAVMTVVLGLANIAVPLGLVCGVLGMGLGMTSGLFPRELLPGFWQDWVYGWVPQRFIGDGVRAVLYHGDGWWNAASEPLMVVLCVGLVILIIAGLLPITRNRDSR